MNKHIGKCKGCGNPIKICRFYNGGKPCEESEKE